MTRVDFLLGDWATEIRHPLIDDPVRGRAVVEPLGAFVVQRATVEHPDFPDSVSILDGSKMHYFDTRGVARVLEVEVEDDAFTLFREPKDASDFWQRFIGELKDDGRTIEGHWETSDDGASWKLDFPITWTKQT